MVPTLTSGAHGTAFNSASTSAPGGMTWNRWSTLLFSDKPMRRNIRNCPVLSGQRSVQLAGTKKLRLLLFSAWLCCITTGGNDITVSGVLGLETTLHWPPKREGEGKKTHINKKKCSMYTVGTAERKGRKPDMGCFWLLLLYFPSSDNIDGICAG